MHENQLSWKQIFLLLFFITFSRGYSLTVLLWTCVWQRQRPAIVWPFSLYVAKLKRDKKHMLERRESLGGHWKSVLTTVMRNCRCNWRNAINNCFNKETLQYSRNSVFSHHYLPVMNEKDLPWGSPTDLLQCWNSLLLAPFLLQSFWGNTRTFQLFQQHANVF